MVERAERRLPLWMLLLALLALLFLIYWCIEKGKHNRHIIQEKVQANATQAIQDAGLAVPTVTADGRDITLSGVVDRTVNFDALKNAAQEGDGVRTVALDLQSADALPAKVSLVANGDSAVVSGMVASDEERGQIISAAEDIYKGGVTDQLQVSGDVDRESWIGGLTGWMPNLSGIRNAKMDANAQRISVSGSVISADDANALRQGLAGAAADGQGTEMELDIYGGQRPSRAEITLREGVVVIKGEVDSQDTVNSIKTAAGAAFSGRRIDSAGLISNVEAASPQWAANIGSIMEEARIVGDGAKVELSDSRIVVAGEVDSLNQKSGIINRVSAANSGANVVDQLTIRQPEPQPAVVESVAKKLDSLDLPGLQFESASANLTAESVAKLGGLVALMNEYSDARVRIVGHTDSIGNAAYNLQLSRDRAKSVVNYLVSQGIDVGRLESNGMGMTQPIASNDTKEGRRQNRRIEFSLID